MSHHRRIWFASRGTDRLEGARDDEAPALRVRGLRKAFGEKVAVADLDLVVPRGSFFGLVGPNGAGKTTTLSMAVGLLRPDRGFSEVLGADVWREPTAARRGMGVLPDALALPERLTARETLTLLGHLRGLEADELETRVDDLLEMMGLQHENRTLSIDYSTGMRKKLGLAMALLHRPKLLVLDEPFESVDPISAYSLKSILRGFVDGGGSIVFSSHVMALVEQLCDTVGVMSRGHLVAEGPLHIVRARHETLEEAFVALVEPDGVDGERHRW